MCGGRKTAAQLQLLEERVRGGEVVVVLDQLVVARVLDVTRVALHDRAHLDVEAARDTPVLGVRAAEDSKREDVVPVEGVRDVVGQAAERLFFVPADLCTEGEWIQWHKLVRVVVDNGLELVDRLLEVVHVLLGV